MVNQLRALGAEPVLVTSLTRRTFFDNGTIQDLLGPWADETILISQELNTHLLDLHANSITYVEGMRFFINYGKLGLILDTAIGPDAAHRLNRYDEPYSMLYVARRILGSQMTTRT
jgi:hypothetical protein